MVLIGGEISFKMIARQGHLDRDLSDPISNSINDIM